MADFSQIANSPIVPMTPFRGFPLQLQNRRMKQGQILLFSWVSGIAHLVMTFFISSVSLALKLSHFDTGRQVVKAADKKSKKNKLIIN